MIHSWLRNALIGLGAIMVVIGLLVCYLLWISPVARLGKHNQQQAHLVQPGMSARQARQLMGSPQERRLLAATGDTLYSYQAASFSSDGLITITMSHAGVVKSIGY